MSIPNTADDLFALIRKSGLVEEQNLSDFIAVHQRDGVLQSDAKKIVLAMVREGLITNFQGEQYLLGKWRGFTIGKFKLLERIGVGGMGQVFLCEHTLMRRRMAVKVLPPSKAEDPVALGRFYREARIAARLEHPNVVRTLDIDQDGPLHYLVMEYVDGTSLLEIIRRFGPLSVPRACHYVRHACMGLQHAHAAGMIHRDIKPGNIIVDRHGTAKLLDLGLARFSRDEKDQLTLKYDDRNVLGTADYVAPEQTRDSRNIDIRADIYGMGATFYYLLTGQPPFTVETIAEKLIAHQTKKPKSVRELRPEIPVGVSKIIEKMLAKDPKDRYQTPQEVVDALESWTETPIDPPSADEMPRLSPAAMDPNFSPMKAKTAPTGLRDAIEVSTQPQPKIPVDFPSAPLPEPSAADFDEARTIPVPPRLHPFGAKPGNGALGDAPQPKPAALKPFSSPGTVKTPGAEPPRLPSSSPGKSVLPPLRPSGHGTTKKPLPGSSIPKGPATGKTSEPPAELPRPPAIPPIELSKLRSFHGLAVPPGGVNNPPSAPPPFEPRLPLSHQAATPAPRSPELPTPRPAPYVEPPRHAPQAGAPAYKPPSVLPFFDEPIDSNRPGLLGQLFRWFLMIAVATVIGAGLGVAIWFQFMRPPG